MSAALPLYYKPLGVRDYLATWHAMRDFTDTRSIDTPDELWVTEHPPVFTQGQAGKPEHLLHASSIPVIKTDRGGQITYHGPGQLVVYPLLNLKRRKLGVRDVVTTIETAVVKWLATYDVEAAPRADAPGVYVGERKIASLGLRVRKGCSYHGVAINIHTDLAPFAQINPCGYAGLSMLNLDSLITTAPGVPEAGEAFAGVLAEVLGAALVR